MIYTTFDQWENGRFLETGEPRKKAYSNDERALIEMGWNYGYDAGVQWQKSQQALDNKAENAKELGLEYEPDQENTLRWHALNYRTASSQNAQIMFETLENFVEQSRQRQPLSDKQIKDALADMSELQMPFNKLIPAIARAIEAAHGIKGDL